MCHLLLTRYSCSHTSPLHPPGYNRPSIGKVPTHPDTEVQTCQDAGRRGALCRSLLGSLDVVYRDVARVCEACEERERERKERENQNGAKEGEGKGEQE